MAEPGLFDNFNPFERVATNQHGLVGHTITKGTLIAFAYPRSLADKPNIIHDPFPLVIITDIWPRYIRGVNLHYLTFPYIKNILQGNCGNTAYSYNAVSGDKYIVNAFRMYFRQGMSKVKKMDCAFLLDLLGAVRSWSPGEIEAIKNQIKAQIQKRIQMKADELTAIDQQAELNARQQAAIDRKVNDVQWAMQGGAHRDLIYPQEHRTGLAPANSPLPPGGMYSNEDLPKG